MNADCLIIPIDSQTSDALSLAMRLSENEATRRVSALAQLLNAKTLRGLGDPGLDSLRQGILLYHELGLFRQRVQGLGKAQQAETGHHLIVDPLFALTSPLWITTINPKHIIFAHGGLGSIAKDLRTVFHDPIENYSELARTLISEVTSKLPVGCPYQVLEIEANQAASLLDRKNLKVFQNEASQNEIRDFTKLDNKVGQGKWLAWALMESKFNIKKPTASIDFTNQYRMLELQLLSGSFNSIEFEKDDSKAIEKMKKSFGEYHEPRVRPIGRRIRYALQMLFNGKVKWKHRS